MNLKGLPELAKRIYYCEDYQVHNKHHTHLMIIRKGDGYLYDLPIREDLSEGWTVLYRTDWPQSQKDLVRMEAEANGVPAGSQLQPGN